MAKFLVIIERKNNMNVYSILLMAFRSIYSQISNKEEFLTLAAKELQKYRDGLYPTIPMDVFLEEIIKLLTDEKT